MDQPMREWEQTRLSMHDVFDAFNIKAQSVTALTDFESLRHDLARSISRTKKKTLSDSAYFDKIGELAGGDDISG